MGLIADGRSQGAAIIGSKNQPVLFLISQVSVCACLLRVLFWNSPVSPCLLNSKGPPKASPTDHFYSTNLPYLGLHPVFPSPFPLPFHYSPSRPVPFLAWLVAILSPFLPFPISQTSACFDPSRRRLRLIPFVRYHSDSSLRLCLSCTLFFSSLFFRLFLFLLLFSVCPEDNHFSFRFSFARPL